MSIFKVILVRIFPYSGKIRTRITPNTDTFQAVFLNNQFQRVFIIKLSNFWMESRCFPGFNSWATNFWVYINNICSNLSTNVKLFADHTSLFSIMNDGNESFENLRNDLSIISNWAYQWKMYFNPDRSKQAQEVIFSRKTSI